MSVSWQDRLDDASSVHEVVGIAKDFLATWDRFEIAALPEPCRPGKIFDENDVNAYALQLVQFGCAADSQAAPLMGKMAAFFSNASVRLSAILSAVGAAGEGEPRPAA